MGKKYEKNIKQIQDMVDGNYAGKTVIGMHQPEDVHANKKIGDRWTDADGKEWEKTIYGRASIKKTPNTGLFSKQCKDCKKNCSVKKIDKDTWMRMGRCMYCQIDFEAKLKTWPIKYWAWIKLQSLQKWETMDREALQYLEEKEKINKKDRYDKTVANALANAEIDINKVKLGG